MHLPIDNGLPTTHKCSPPRTTATTTIYLSNTIKPIPIMNITHSIVSERDRALLAGDYSSYHSQATRRIHNLRRRLGASNRGRKYNPKGPVTADNVAQNAEYSLPNSYLPLHLLTLLL